MKFESVKQAIFGICCTKILIDQTNSGKVISGGKVWFLEE